MCGRHPLTDQPIGERPVFLLTTGLAAVTTEGCVRSPVGRQRGTSDALQYGWERRCAEVCTCVGLRFEDVQRRVPEQGDMPEEASNSEEEFF
eukprot:8342513-Karenia_brevis.AAC.1